MKREQLSDLAAFVAVAQERSFTRVHVDGQLTFNALDGVDRLAQPQTGKSRKLEGGGIRRAWGGSRIC